MSQLLATHRSSTNFATADRPRCMLRDENFVRHNRHYRRYDYGDYDDEYEQTTWYWNMSHHQSNGNALINAKKSHQKSKNALYASQRSHSSSGFQSFFRWFKRDEKSRAVSDISYPREITSSSDTLELEHDKRIPKNSRRPLKAFDSNDNISPPSSPRLSRTFSQSSSCDSVFSTASSFAFVPPVKYLSNRNQRQPEKAIPDRSHAEIYQRKFKARHQARELDKKSELNLRQKYQLYAESSDAETNNNTLKASNQNIPKVSHRYQDLSLPTTRKSNLPDSAKLHDLNASKHRRTSSDSSKDKRSGAYLHVKGKRKAPPPPPNPRTLSPKSSLGRKKRPAPQPPNLNEGATSSTSLLEDREIKAIIEGTSRTLSQNFSASSASSISISSDMEPRKTYISPYLKIREDRKLTDEQKRILIEHVTKNSKREEKSPEPEQVTKRATPDMFTIERGQLVYQGNESPKLPRKEEKLVAPSSPISPRPWFKRQSSSGHKESNQLKTLEKRKSKNDDKDLPECGYSRNSFFASRFNIFARISEDSKKKDRDPEKRRSQIGIPNISELDREAAEIIQMGHELNQSNKKLNASELLMLRSQINNLNDSPIDDTRQRSARDLISKYEADTSHINRITVNTAFVARKEFFGDKFPPEKEKSDAVMKNDFSKSKLPQLIKDTNGIRKQNDLMGLWTCPYCTLENPNWKIICEACEKIKPYEKRFCVNGELPKSKITQNPKLADNTWDKKTEVMLKYFNPPLTNTLSKSASETAIAKSLKRKSPSPSRMSGSPQLNLRRNIFKTDQHDQKIEAIEEETLEKDDKKVLKIEDSVIVKTTPVIYSLTEDPKPDKEEAKKTTTPDMSEVRSARLAKFNLMSNLKRKQLDDNTNNTNHKQSPEKKFPDKLDFSDPVALEREKERLREKIRAMNAKALADKYPVLKRIPENQETPQTFESTAQTNPPEPQNLGAIRKVIKPLETRRESIDEKIMNGDEKPEKVSISVQTKIDVKKSLRKSEDAGFVPTTVVELQKPEVKKETELTLKQREEVKEISDQLKSKDGIETFKATLRTKSINTTNTLAINKILRNLENAISEGKYDDAAQLAKDLAKMKVSLSVTRQKERPKSDVDINLKDIRINLHVKDGVKNVVNFIVFNSLLMTVNDLKRKIEEDYKIRSADQKIVIDDKTVESGDKLLGDFKLNDNVIDVIVIDTTLPIQQNIFIKNAFSLHHDSESDDETQNEKVGIVEGAIGGDLAAPPKLKIEEDGWECPLCTLINMPNRPGCLACSTSRPTSYKVPTRYQEIEYKLKVNEDLRTFFDMDKVEVRPQSQTKNDLNRQSVNRKSSDVFNILVEEKPPVVKEQIESINPDILVPHLIVTSPNITRNKYRGVDNFNPNKCYVFPKTSDVRKPVITSVIYKSSPASAKDTTTQNHYQQLVNLDFSGIAPNTELFECSICFMEIAPRAGAVLRECLHSFCKACLASHIKYCEEAEIKCPFMDSQYSCQCLLQEREIRALVTKEEYDKHLARSIRLAENKIENTFHCKTPNCRGWCIFEDTSNSFRCPVCTIVNCLTCGVVHDGINCKQYQDLLSNDVDSESAKQTKQLLQDLIDKEEALNCPTCHIFLLKKWGCDWLKCSFCKTEICWVTRGPRWGPNGKGDITGGCKCGVNGKKCSPKCNYCH